MTTTQERIAYVKKHSPRNAESTVAMLEDLPTAKAKHIKRFGRCFHWIRYHNRDI